MSEDYKLFKESQTEDSTRLYLYLVQCDNEEWHLVGRQFEQYFYYYGAWSILNRVESIKDKPPYAKSLGEACKLNPNLRGNAIIMTYATFLDRCEYLRNLHNTFVTSIWDKIQ